LDNLHSSGMAGLGHFPSFSMNHYAPMRVIIGNGRMNNRPA
jgi:hypothetical protein